MKESEVNECLLEIDDCDENAHCNDKEDGYTCTCVPGYEDANPNNPGRSCLGASCGFCNTHGTCQWDVDAGNTTCLCHAG